MSTIVIKCCFFLGSSHNFTCSAIKRNKGNKLWKDWRGGRKGDEKKRWGGMKEKAGTILNVTLFLLLVVKVLGF